MQQDVSLIMTLSVGLAAAFVAGMLAQRLRLPPLVGYLIAGVAIGPFTPGIVADTHLAQELAEVGVILLMFGVGLHFSMQDLWEARRIALPGAVAQITIATLLGWGASQLWGWSMGAGLIFGLALSVASTVVLLRALEQRGIVQSANGRIAVGWLVVEDLAMVLALVLLPALAVPLGGDPAAAGHSAGAPPPGGLVGLIAWTLTKVAAFVAFMLLAGRRVFPWMLSRVANTGSRELFTLAVLASSLGVAYLAAALFDVSFALGAFFAGVVVSGSHLSHKVAEDALPLQDAFAVLFFVSVGMLFNPRAFIDTPGWVLATVAIIVVGKSIAAMLIVWLFRYPMRTALVVAVSLAQIGEFSFILAELGLQLGILPPEAVNLILAGAIVSITLNPLLFSLVDKLQAYLSTHPGLTRRFDAHAEDHPAPLASSLQLLQEHAILVGYGRVGRQIAEAFEDVGAAYIVVEQSHHTLDELRDQGIPALYGDATHPTVLDQAGLTDARLLVVAIPSPLEARMIVAYARSVRPDLWIVARTHTREEQQFLLKHGANQTVYGETELARAMVRHAMNGLWPIPAEQADMAPER